MEEEGSRPTTPDLTDFISGISRVCMYRVNPGDNQDEDIIGQDVFVAQAPNVSTGGGTLAPPATHTGGADQERVASEAGSQDAQGSSSGWTGADPNDLSLARDVINWTEVPPNRQPPPRTLRDRDVETDDVGRPSRLHAAEAFLPADGDANVYEVPARYVEPPLRQPPQ